MKSQTRIECENAVRDYASIVTNNLKSGKLLYVGIAGDPPGGEYTPFFPTLDTKTFDYDAVWKPDIVGDITRTEFDNESWDCIVCVQVIEHVKNIWDIPKEMHRILKPGGYVIVDSPFMYKYHAEPPSFGDYWRITKDGMDALFGPYFTLEKVTATDNLTSCLLRKK